MSRLTETSVSQQKQSVSATGTFHPQTFHAKDIFKVSFPLLELGKTPNQWIFRINYCVTRGACRGVTVAGLPGLIFLLVVVMVHYCSPDRDDGQIKQTTASSYKWGQHPGHSFRSVPGENPPRASINLEKSFQFLSLTIQFLNLSFLPSFLPCLLTFHLMAKSALSLCLKLPAVK